MMPIEFTCPYCGKRTNVSDEFAGHSGPCSGCGQTITIPGSAPVTEKPFAMENSFPAGKTWAAEDPTVVGGPQPKRSKWLVPLLIVAASIIPFLMCGGVLLALLLPAIQAAREAARRTQCNNNLRNISLGLQNYHDTYKTFPAGAMHVGTKDESERLGPSWWCGTMPFLEQRALYDKMIQLQQPGAPGNGAYNAQNINAYIPGSPLTHITPEFMRCPSSRLPAMETPTGPVALPTYVGISGGCDIAAGSPDYQGGVGLVPPTSNHDYINRQKGIGHVPGGIITASGVLPAYEYIRMRDITDGTSNTMIVAEQSDWLRDIDPNISTMYHGDPGWDTNGTGPMTPSTTAGGGFVSGTVESVRIPMANAGMPGAPPTAYDCYNISTVRYRAGLKKVMGRTPLPGCSEDHGINNPLQSSHPGGILVTFVDGSVQFISNTTDLAMLLRLAIRDDGQNVRWD